MKKLLAVLLCAALFAGCLSGCQEMVMGAVGLSQQAAQAAADKITEKMTEIIGQHKVEVVEMKTAFGTIAIKDDWGKELLAAVLIRTESDSAAETCAKALSGIFSETGFVRQTGREVELELLCFQSITYDHTDYADGSYYTVYGYSPSVVGSK